MKLSIIIPMYNVEKYIDSCILSLLRQDIPIDEYEVIVIDDGSKDDSRIIVEKYSSRYNNIKLISVENGGQSKARNIGINNAKGDYIFFVDSDDYISDNCLNKLLNTSYDNRLDILFFDMKRVKEENHNKCLYAGYDTVNVMDGIEYFALNNVNNGPCHFIISKRFIDDNNLRFIEGKYCEDGMFLISIILKAKRVAYCGADIYRYVERQQSTTRIKTKEHSKKMIEDFMFTVNYINNVYNQCLDKNYPEQFLKRLKSRRNSYIYFMQIRMIKSKLGIEHAKKIVKELETIKCYNYSRMSKSEYSDIKTTIIWSILNTKYLFYILCI